MSEATVIRVRQWQPYRLRVTGPDRRTLTEAAESTAFRGAVVGARGAATAVDSYEHVQSTPATVWNINHNRGSRPVSVAVYTDGYVEVDAAVQSPTPNLTIITVAEPMAGFAYLL